jgi:hypothetical protein
MFACENSDAEAVDILLMAHADVNIDDGHHTALDRARDPNIRKAIIRFGGRCANGSLTHMDPVPSTW